MACNKIFISYSRQNTEYVSTLVNALRKQGFEVWFDKNIRTGTDWDDTIEEELKKADALVLILSKTSVTSENVKDEISYAIGLDKSVNPIKIEECDVPMRLARRQFVDFTAMGHDAGFERLVKDLKQNLELADQHKAVPMGSFTPPVGSTANPSYVPPKKTKKIMPYIIGGIVALIVFIFIVAQCGGDDTTSNNIVNTTVTSSASPEWQDALNKNSIERYVKYIQNFGKDEYYPDAIDSLGELMPNEGLIKFWDANGARYFTKILYTGLDGTLMYVQDNNEMPRTNDILSAISSQEIYSVKDRQILHGESIITGQKVIVYEVANYDDNSVWITVGYEK